MCHNDVKAQMSWEKHQQIGKVLPKASYNSWHVLLLTNDDLTPATHPIWDWWWCECGWIQC